MSHLGVILLPIPILKHQSLLGTAPVGLQSKGLVDEARFSCQLTPCTKHAGWLICHFWLRWRVFFTSICCLGAFVSHLSGLLSSGRLRSSVGFQIWGVSCGSVHGGHGGSVRVLSLITFHLQPETGKFNQVFIAGNNNGSQVEWSPLDVGQRPQIVVACHSGCVATIWPMTFPKGLFFFALAPYCLLHSMRGITYIAFARMQPVKWWQT